MQDCNNWLRYSRERALQKSAKISLRKCFFRCENALRCSRLRSGFTLCARFSRGRSCASSTWPRMVQPGKRHLFLGSKGGGIGILKKNRCLVHKILEGLFSAVSKPRHQICPPSAHPPSACPPSARPPSARPPSARPSSSSCPSQVLAAGFRRSASVPRIAA